MCDGGWRDDTELHRDGGGDDDVNEPRRTRKNDETAGDLGDGKELCVIDAGVMEYREAWELQGSGRICG